MVTPRKTPAKEPSESPLSRLGRTDTARYLKVSLATIKRFEKEGILKPTKDEHGHNWFDMPQLETLRAEREGLPAPETEVMVSTIDGAVMQAKDSGKHTERILGLVLDPGESLLKLYKETCKDLAEECKKWRDAHFELLTKMSEMLKSQRQEDIEQRRIELSDARKGQAIGLVKQAIPMLIAQAGGNKQLGQLLTFVQSLEPEQLRILLDSGLLTQAQVQALSLVLTEAQQSALAKPPNTSEQETPEENS